MAIGRGRSSKRQSSSPYIPTVSTIIFLLLCVFGLWMISSTIIPRQNTPNSNPDFIKAERDLPAFNDDGVKGNRDESKTAIHDNQKLQEEKLSDPDSNTKAAIAETEGNVVGEIQPQEKSSVEDDKKNYETTDANDEKDQSFSSSTEEKPQVQEQRDSVEDQHKKQEIQEESNETQQQSLTENQKDESAQMGAESQETQEIRNEESNGNQDQQQKIEMETEEKTKKDTEGDQNQESQEQQNSEAKNNQGDEIHGKELESGIRQVTTEEEIQQQNDRGTQESQTTENENTQHDEQGESTSVSADNQETQIQKQHQSEGANTESQDQELQNQETQHEQKSEGENQELQQQQQTESIAKEIENQESQQQSEQESTSLLENQEAAKDNQVETQQSDQKEQENQEEAQQSDRREQENQEGLQENDQKEKQNQEETQQSGQRDSERDTKPMGIPKESKESKREWSTQAAQSENEKERVERRKESEARRIYERTWQPCNVSAGADYIPCLDNVEALKHLHITGHFEHRERHCPEEGPTCLVPLPHGYKLPIEWPSSRDKIWYHNVPHTKLAEVKGHQNWVKVAGEFLTFPGGGTQFIHGALHYIDFIQQTEPRIAWGKHTRVVLDVGCGVASFGGYLFERDVLTMSFAPKDEHEAQVQFALERGIPAISAVMGSQRLPFPARVFDLIHCARCRVPWHVEGGRLLLELNRVLRPGGFFVWSATPVYQKLKEDVEIWEAMTALTKSMCWDLYAIKKDKLNSVAAAVYRKPISNACYDQRQNMSPPMCKQDDDPNAAWYVPLQSCMHRQPIGKSQRGSKWPEDWPIRLKKAPYWLNNSQMGIYGHPAPDDFVDDYKHWKLEVKNLYLNGLAINWPKVRNIMDMRAVYGGFAAALKDLKVWVMNVVNVDCPDTLPIIYERGLFGIYHDWCESFSTYPRTYDLLHADHLFSKLMKRCKVVPVMAEIDRIIRPGGTLIVRDDSSTVNEIQNILKSLHWEIHYSFSKDKEAILSAEKSDWRPESLSTS